MLNPVRIGDVGYPAYAGIDLKSIILAIVKSWLPRIRGDRPMDEYKEIEEKAATPHTRGSTRSYVPFFACGNGYPAYAGIDRSLAGS